MARYRKNLPQTSGDLFMTDAGLETVLIFQEGHDLPEFASFDLVKDEAGTDVLRGYFRRFADMAQRYGVGVVLESATWRASRDWGAKIGYTPEALDEMNRKAVQLMTEVREEYDPNAKIVISGCIGPRGDGYSPESQMSADEAEAFHSMQARTLSETDADMIGAITMTHTGEALGIARAAMAVDMPVAVSFTVETDGRLPTGQPLGEAIMEVDDATGAAPAYYMINCAHPTHFAETLGDGDGWHDRIRGIRANASKMSHAELDEAEELDDGNPVELGGHYGELKGTLRNLSVVGGCCGTDHRHVEEMVKAML